MSAHKRKIQYTANSTIARYISGLKRLINRKIGHNIWQRGYYDHIIRNEGDFRNSWLYTNFQ